MRSRLYIIAILLITIFINSPLPAQAAGFPVSLAESIEAMRKLKSYEHASKISMNLDLMTGSVTETINYALTTTGKVIQGKSPSYSFVFDLFMGGITDNRPFSINAGIESIFLKNTLYLNLKRLTFTSDEFTNYESGLIDEQLKDIKNVWVKIKLSELSEYTSDTTLTDIASSDATEDFLADIEALEQLNIVTFVRQAQESTINGKLTRRYILTFDKAKFIALANPNLSATEKAEFQEVSSSINITPFDVWIDETTMLPMKISGSISLKNLDLDFNERISTTITIESTLGKINSVKKIKAPKKAKSLEKIFELLY